MKCYELEADKTFVFGEECLAYKKSDVDATIAELKAENQRLKKCEIWMKQHFYCEEVIACESAKNRKLKRALWLARAEKNELLSNYRELDNYMYGLMVAGKRSHYEDYENHADSYNEWTTKLSNAAQVCRAKAEEYK